MPTTRNFGPGAALVAIQRSALFDHSAWNESSDPCLDAWRGVTCSALGRVTRLTIDGADASRLAPVGNLSALTSLCEPPPPARV